MKHALKTIGMATMSALMASGCVMLGPDFQEPSAPFESKWMEDAMVIEGKDNWIF